MTKASLKTPTISAVWKIPKSEDMATITREIQKLGVKSPKPRFVIVTPINHTVSAYSVRG